jgi:hypothetical protein
MDSKVTSCPTPHSTPKKKTIGNLNQMLKKNYCSNMSCRQKESWSSEEKWENASLSAFPDKTVISNLVKDTRFQKRR